MMPGFVSEKKRVLQYIPSSLALKITEEQFLGRGSVD